jgi:hypothetical protein
MNDYPCDPGSEDEGESPHSPRPVRVSGTTVALMVKGGTALVECGVILYLAEQGSLRMNAALAVLALARAALTVQETARKLGGPQR